MHKVKKFDPGEALSFDPYKSYSEKMKKKNPLGGSSSLFGTKKKDAFGDLESTWELPKPILPLDFSAQTAYGATIPQQRLDAGLPLFDPKLGKGSGAVKNGLFSGKQGVMNGADVAGFGMEAVSSFLKPLDNVSGASAGLSAASDVLGAIPTPYTKAASAVIKGVVLADQALGKSANKLSTKGTDSTGYALNDVSAAGTSFGGIFGNKARKQTNKLVANTDLENIKKLRASRAGEKDLLAGTNATADTANRNYDTLIGGKKTNILAAQEGIKLLIKKAHLLRKGGEVNVIPSGALHKELNHLEGDHTKKGIPVILESGGELEQQAEIEREEIIFNLGLTKQLEELHKKFKDGDENAAIEAGKILTYEILENTVDNVNLIDKIE